MNVELLGKVRKQILAEPRQFVMDGWAMNEADVTRNRYEASSLSAARRAMVDIRRTIPNCRTAACIAGWTVAIEDGHFKPALVRDIDPSVVPRVAMRALGIKFTEAMILFYRDYWPVRFMEQWRKARSPKARAQVASRRILHFIATNGAE